MGLRIGWGIGSLGSTSLINGVTFLALFYFTQILQIPPALAGGLLFGAKIFDIITDPLMGYISDRVTTPWGRRRPFLLAGGLISGLAFLMLFSTPELDVRGTLFWVTTGLLLYATGYTLFNIPYLAMPAEMTRDYHERSRLMSARVIFAQMGILAGGSLAPWLVSYLGGGPGGYAGMAGIMGMVIAGSMIVCFLSTGAAAQTRRTETALTVRAQWRLALSNRPFVVLMLSKFLHMLGVSLSLSSLLFVLTIVLQRDTAAALPFGVSAAVGAALAMPIWLMLCSRVGKRWTYIIGVVIYMPALMSWLVAGPEEPAQWLIYRGLAIGVVTGGLTLTAQAMLPDVIEHDAERSGLRREAVFTSVYSLMEKTAFAAGPLIVGLVLQGAADGGDGGNSAPAVLLAAVWLPALASTASALILLAYGLDRELMVRESRGTG